MIDKVKPLASIPMMGQKYYDENGAVTVIGYDHPAHVEIARLNDDLTCHSEALLAWKMNCQHLLDIMDNQGFDERDLGDEDEAAIRGIRIDLQFAERV